MPFGPFPIAFKLDRTRNAAAQAYDHLRELIVTMVLVPGTQLDRSEMAEYFGLSSTPVRDALTRLSDEGLIDIVPQQATIIREIDPGSVEETNFLRLSMELEVIQLLAKQRDPVTLHALETLLSQQAFHLSRKDYGRFAHYDMEFHQQMFRSANVEALWDFLRSKSGDLDRLLHLHTPKQDNVKVVYADNASLLLAISSGDAVTAQNCLRDQLSNIAAALEPLMQRYPGYFLDKN
ncbi:MAG TPA: GntR family transcriptional regulator [Paraburkholderia sp.]|uniref:GntR family transcriptional regulator n=1 Tax=Paraburkholderia sp. TaxID=1926495 RepID=UPI002B461556|nr:GntR family transcriptional regulator [Paraburkholderia sp.]HKR39907.1 GntR family transcriptional regulator [Paraburkholderia sp.]